MKFLIKFLATGSFLGYSPYVPGAFGSAAGILIYWFLPEDPVLYWRFMLIFAFGGTVISHSAEKIFGETDSRKIVIDEVTGMLFAMAFLPKNIFFALTGFLMFRIFDGLNLYPAGRLEELGGGLGIMLDDIAAGVMVNLILHILALFL